jgi:hypothetical protein
MAGPTLPLPTQFPAVDTITIAGVQPVGKWTLTRASKVYGWQIQKGYALSGATVFPIGDELVKPRFLVELWDGAVQWPAFRLFRSKFLKKALVSVGGAAPSYALGIDHPELKDLGVTSVVVLEINPVLNDGYGLWSTEIEFLQYRKPQPALSKPLAAIPDAAPPVPTAQNNAERELQKAAAQFQSLAGQL